MDFKGTLISISIGVLFIIVGIVVLNQGNNLKRRCTEETIGTVVELILERGYDNKYTYFPVVEYQAGDRRVSQKSRSGQKPPKYKEGEKIEICYNPDNIQEYIIKGDLTSSFLGILAIVLGSIAVVVSFIIRNS